MPTWPNLFIAGAPRCGTTSLHAWLHEIPGIYMSRIKEPNYFSREVVADDHPMLRPIRDEMQYLQLFSGAGDAEVVGEASPTYLRDAQAPILIDRKIPGAKILVSLRDPVERLFSHYLMMRNNCTDMGSFMSEIERGLAAPETGRFPVLPPDVGLYCPQVERYRNIFGGQRFKVLIFEELMADVPGTLRHVLAFLRIDHDVSDFAEPAQRQYGEARSALVRYLFGNRTVSRAMETLIPYRLRKFVRNALLVKQIPKPQMDADARQFLVRYYSDDVRQLEQLLGRRLPWRNFG